LFFTANTPDGAPVELFKVFGGYGYFDENFSDPGYLYEGIDQLYEKIMQKAEGVYPEAGYRQVVMHPDLAGILAHEAVGHTVEADLVLGGSVAAHNLGKKVASDMITMIDFANTALGKPAPLPIFVDDEGTLCEDAVLIKDGILTGYMNNRESAQHFNMKPQGNARAYLFSDEPLIRMRNTAILPGRDKLQDMIASIDNGYYLTNTNNGQADTTGEFMFGISMGYEIKNGKIGKAIRDTTISGIAFEMLKTVDMLSDDMYWTCSGMCGKKQPMPVGMGGPAIKCKVTMGGR
jgi:TldD protein